LSRAYRPVFHQHPLGHRVGKDFGQAEVQSALLLHGLTEEVGRHGRVVTGEELLGAGCVAHRGLQWSAIGQGTTGSPRRMPRRIPRRTNGGRQSIVPRAPIHIAAGRPSSWIVSAASRLPSGTTPHSRNRSTEFVRLSSRGG